MSHQGSLLVLPSGMRAWNVDGKTSLDIKHFDSVSAERDFFEFLIIGCGNTMVPLAIDVVQYLKAQRISFDLMTTSAAVRTYNVLLDDGRQVAAGFISVADARR
jgi:uncharacterized protein